MLLSYSLLNRARSKEKETREAACTGIALHAATTPARTADRTRPAGQVLCIDVHAARGLPARPVARGFGPARARHDPMTSEPGLARAEAPGRAWATT
jgi:hypothetical protein